MAERDPYPPLTLGTETREQVARAAQQVGRGQPVGVLGDRPVVETRVRVQQAQLPTRRRGDAN